MLVALECWFMRSSIVIRENDRKKGCCSRQEKGMCSDQEKKTAEKKVPRIVPAGIWILSLLPGFGWLVFIAALILIIVRTDSHSFSRVWYVTENKFTKFWILE
jgi:hypothetical protein